MLKCTLPVLIAVAAPLAHAETVCKDYAKKGDVAITRICGERGNDGTIRNPLLFAGDLDLRISKGLIFSRHRAKRICSALGQGRLITFTVDLCNQEASAVNLRGNYDSSAGLIYGTGECFASVTCEPSPASSESAANL